MFATTYTGSMAAGTVISLAVLTETTMLLQGDKAATAELHEAAATAPAKVPPVTVCRSSPPTETIVVTVNWYGGAGGRPGGLSGGGEGGGGRGGDGGDGGRQGGLLGGMRSTGAGFNGDGELGGKGGGGSSGGTGGGKGGVGGGEGGGGGSVQSQRTARPSSIAMPVSEGLIEFTHRSGTP